MDSSHNHTYSARKSPWLYPQDPLLTIYIATTLVRATLSLTEFRKAALAGIPQRCSPKTQVHPRQPSAQALPQLPMSA